MSWVRAAAVVSTRQCQPPLVPGTIAVEDGIFLVRSAGAGGTQRFSPESCSGSVVCGQKVEQALSRGWVLPASPPPASACCSWRFCRSFLRSALLVASSGSAASWPNQFRPLRCPELPLAGEVDFCGELGGRFPDRSFNQISPFPSKSIPSPFPEKAGTRWCDSKEWLTEVENDGGTQSPNLV